MLREPRSKKHGKIKKSLPLPLFQNYDNEPIKFVGKFNGFSINIENLQEMEKLYYNGFFGKANLSRGFPCFSKNSLEHIEILRERQFKRRTEWKKALMADTKTQARQVLVVPDSDSETEVDDYFTNLKAQYQIDNSVVKETVNLSLEEAMFLTSALDCLNIFDLNDKLLNTKEMWELFNESDPYFVQNYIAYYYFRSKNWVVKSGIKFGGDFLLYKEGPPFYHASYLVIIDVLQEESSRAEHLCRRSMDTENIIGLNRLCETAGKDLLIFQIIWPKDAQISAPEDISKVSVKTVLVNRWILPQEREQKDEDL